MILNHRHNNYVVHQVTSHLYEYESFKNEYTTHSAAYCSAPCIAVHVGPTCIHVLLAECKKINSQF